VEKEACREKMERVSGVERDIGGVGETMGEIYVGEDGHKERERGGGGERERIIFF
jgi:hypothetical protein